MPPFSRLFKSKPSRPGSSASVRSEVVQKGKLGLFKFSDKDPDAKGCVDIIAVHGLGGDPYRTWQHETGYIWLRDFLPAQIPNSRIMSYGYDSTVAFSRSTAELDDFARDLLHWVDIERASDAEKQRPIVFVCHSLGGLLFKRALSIGKESSSAYAELISRILGVAFMGTPHGGSNVAVWSSYAAKMLKSATFGTTTNADLVDLLRKDSKYLSNLNETFKAQCGSLRVLSFYETVKFPFMNAPIVEKQSAAVNIAKETLLPIPADHRAMCRFSSAEDQVYRPVWKAIAVLCLSYRANSENHLMAPISASEHLATLKQWLDPVPAHEDFDRLRAKRLYDSCHWLDHKNGYKNWLDLYDGRRRLLWIEGPPGCGKSVLATKVVEDSQSRGKTCYFFCNSKDAGRQTLQQILRTWTWQLIQQNPKLVDVILALQMESSAIASQTIFEKALQLAVQSSPNCHLILDGLDECPELDMRKLRDILNVLLTRASVLILSRAEANIESTVFRRIEWVGCRITVKPDDTAEDILRWTEESVSELPLLDAELRSEVSSAINTGAKGMFLWAQLMVDNIGKQATVGDIRASLREVPDDLEDLYNRLVHRIENLPSKQSTIAFRLLQWTISAERPLSTEELDVAIAIQPGDSEFDNNNRVAKLGPETIGAFCGPLLEVDLHLKVVRFVHSSFVDFLRKKIGENNWDARLTPTMRLSSTMASEYAASVCLTVLSYGAEYVSYDRHPDAYEENVTEYLRDRPFLSYSVMNWWRHLPSSGSTELREICKSFFENESSIVRWLQIYQILRGSEAKVNPNLPLPFSPFSPAVVSVSSYDSSKLANLRMSTGALFTRWDRWVTESFFNGDYWIPISIAAFFNFDKAVLEELYRGVSSNIRDLVDFTPVLYAAHGDSPAALEVLIEHGGDVTATTDVGYGAARFASRNSVGVLRTVILAGAPLNLRTGFRQVTVLHAACISLGWHPGILEEILSRCSDEDLNAVDALGQTPLHYAVAIDVKAAAHLFYARYRIEPGHKSDKFRHMSTQEIFTPSNKPAVEAWLTSWLKILHKTDIHEPPPDEVPMGYFDEVALGVKAVIVSRLLERGANLVPDMSGDSPLKLAVTCGLRRSHFPGVEKDPIVEILLGSRSREENMLEVAKLKALRNLAHYEGNDLTRTTIEGSVLTDLEDLHLDTLPAEQNSLYPILTEQSLWPPMTTPQGVSLDDKLRPFAHSWSRQIAEYNQGTSARARRADDVDFACKLTFTMEPGQKVEMLEILLSKVARRIGPLKIAPASFSLPAQELPQVAPYRNRMSGSYMGTSLTPEQSPIYSDVNDGLGSFMHPPSPVSSVKSYPGSYAGRDHSNPGPYSKRSGRLRNYDTSGQVRQILLPILKLRATSYNENGAATTTEFAIASGSGRWKDLSQVTGLDITDQWQQTFFAADNINTEIKMAEDEHMSISKWLATVKDGDVISLVPADMFFVQDIALYGRYGFAIYTSDSKDADR